MDPIDFTRPEAFGQVGAGGPSASLDLNRQSPAPSTAEALRLRRAVRWLLFWIVLAPLSWFMLAALMTFMDTADPQALASATLAGSGLLASLAEPSFLARMRLLAWMTADTLFWPVVVVTAFLLLRGLLGEFMIRRMLARKDAAAGGDVQSMADQSALNSFAMQGGAVQDGLDGLWRLCTLGLGILRVVPVVAAAFAAIWSVMAVNAFLNSYSHWDALPWVTPPYIEEFLARHPTLQVEDAQRKSGLRVVRDGQGHSISLQGSQLVGAQLRLQSCPPDLGAAQLGGIPPYPGIACNTLAQLRDAQGSQTLYVFHLASGSDSAAIFAHFERWADTHGGSKASSVTGDTHYVLHASSRDDAWRLELDSRKGGATSIVIQRSP